MSEQPKIYTVTTNQVGQRLDNLLSKILKGVPKTRIYRAIRNGEVRVNKGRSKPSYKLQIGDRVRIPPLRMGERTISKPPTKLVQSLVEQIIYEDQDLLIINKPANMAVHGGSGINFGVIEILRARTSKLEFLELVHRLDKETSGCLMLAKSRSALTKMHNMLKNNEIAKGYLALLCGIWRGGGRLVKLPLRKNILKSGERMVTVSDMGKMAVSEFIPLKKYSTTTLMKVIIHTGRTHQIRVHAAFLGLPVVGDRKYGDKICNKILAKHGISGLFLHAFFLCFKHPRTEKIMLVSAKLDQKSKVLLRKL